jgi:hypothetical protein
MGSTTSYVKKLRESGEIDKQMVSYNITFKPDMWEDVKDSYF